MVLLLLQKKKLRIEFTNWFTEYSKKSSISSHDDTAHGQPNTTKISKVIKIQALNYCVADKMSYDEYLFCMQFSSSSQFEWNFFSFFLSSMVWKIRIKYKRNSLNTFFFLFLSNIYIFHNTKKSFQLIQLSYTAL